MSLSCKDITIRYPGHAADTLRGISIDVAPGQILGITGVSGAGKSTLLRVLAGLVAPAAGTVTVDGHPLATHPSACERREHAARVALVCQRPEQQFFAATVFEEVGFGARNLGLGEDDVARRVNLALRAMGFDPTAIGPTSPFAHSGGEQRRIAIADMLVLDTPYLLLDEPTAGLDPAVTTCVLHCIEGLARAGHGVLIVSHDPRALAACRDGVARLAGGSLAWERSGPNGRTDRRGVSDAVQPSPAAGPAAGSAANASEHAGDGSAPSASGIPGVFRPGATPVHRLHPVTKLVYCLLYMVAVFLAQTPLAMGAAALAALASLTLSGTSPRGALRLLRPFRWLIGFVLVFNACFTASGPVLVTVGPLDLTAGGLLFSATSVLRFMLVLLGTSTLMSTTSPTALADGTSTLLRPLRRLGLRTDGIALSVQLTLRFVPVLIDELARIKEAQEARLARFDARSPLARARAYVPVIVPMFTGALRRSDTLALAMVNREYGRHSCRRTCARTYRRAASDACVVAAAVALTVLAVASSV